MRALYGLWRAWCYEEGNALDETAWAAHIVDRVMSASFMPIIMYDGEKAIGVCDATFFTDPMTGEFTCFGDHAYVLPEYRKGSVMRKLFESFLAVAQLCGATRCCGPVDSKKAAFLQHLYEQYGGEQVATLMSWRPS
jgi:GNAT superfamily N-acetyltransferase